MKIKFRTYIPNLQWMVPVERIYFDIGTIEVDLSDGNGDTAEYYYGEVPLMQYTGFSVKGVDIFEDDILQLTIDDPVEPMTDVGIVKMSNYSGGWIVEDTNGNFRDMLWDWTTEDAKVVGNVHENPELLKED